MRRNALVAVLLASSMSAGCGTITVPASGTMSTGEEFYGQATASISEGTFQVTNEAGVICSGTYDPLDTSRELTVPFTCTDGRSGSIDIQRDEDLQGGVGTAVFSDGTTGSLKFGQDVGA